MKQNIKSKHLILHVITIILLQFNLTPVSAQQATTIAWIFSARGRLYTDPVVSGGVLYVAPSDGKIYALNKTTGSVSWDFNARKPVNTKLLVVNNLVFFGSDNGIFYALNKSGSEIWNYGTGDMIRSSPVFSNNIIYFGSDDKHVYAINSSNGRLIWKFRTGSSVYYDMRVLGDMVYVPSSDRRLYALDKTSGLLIWNYSFRREPRYIQAFEDEIYVSSDEAMVYVLDASTGSQVRNFTTNGSLTSDILVTADWLIYVSSDGGVHKVHRKSGMTLWDYLTNVSKRGFSSPPAEYNGVVYAGSEGGILYALNLSTGELIWNYTVARGIRSKVVLDDDMLYIGSTDGRLYALGSQPDVYTGSLDYSGMLIEGRVVQFKVEVYNKGSGIAPDVDVTFYVDRDRLYSRNVTLTPKSSTTVEFNWNVTHGTHLLEVLLNKVNKIPESDARNNQYGVLVTAVQDWHRFRRDDKNTGFLNLTDGFSSVRRSISWKCRVEVNNDSWEMREIDLLWSSLMGSIYFNPNEFALRLNCTMSDYFTGHINSIWMCSVSNASQFPLKDFNKMKEYFRSFNETEYNLTLEKQGFVEYPFNITNFNLEWTCTAPPIKNLPMDDYHARWDCYTRRNFNYTPYNHTLAWSCRLTTHSDYLVEEVSNELDYPLHMNSPKLQYGDVSEYRLMWKYKTQGKVRSSPVLTDVDGDGFMELIVGSDDGNIYCLSHDGNIQWSHESNEKIQSTPLVADLDKDGTLEVTVGSNDGKLYNLDNNGKLKWDFKTADKVTSSPLAVNLDETHQNEVIFGSEDEYIYALTHEGLVDWVYKTQGPVVSSPSLMDIDNDGSDEIVVGSNDNNIYALHYPPHILWMYQMNDDVISSPAIMHVSDRRADNIIGLSRDGTIADVFKQRLASVKIPTKTGSRIVERSKLYHSWLFKSGSPSFNSPAVADMDGNGTNEIVFCSGNNLYVLDQSGRRIMRTTFNDPFYSSPALADLDGDGFVEIAVGSSDGLYVLDGDIVGWYYPTGYIHSSPGIADLNNDGLAEIAVGSDDGWIYVFGLTGKQLMDDELPAPSVTSTTSTSTTTTTISTVSMTTTTTLKSITLTAPEILRISSMNCSQKCEIMDMVGVCKGRNRYNRCTLEEWADSEYCDVNMRFGTYDACCEDASYSESSCLPDCRAECSKNGEFLSHCWIEGNDTYCVCSTENNCEEKSSCALSFEGVSECGNGYCCCIARVESLEPARTTSLKQFTIYGLMLLMVAFFFHKLVGKYGLKWRK